MRRGLFGLIWLPFVQADFASLFKLISEFLWQLCYELHLFFGIDAHFFIDLSVDAIHSTAVVFGFIIASLGALPLSWLLLLCCSNTQCNPNKNS